MKEPKRASVPAMSAGHRRSVPPRFALAMLSVAGLLLAGGGCVPDKDKTPEWQKPPTSWDPAGAEHLTFNKKGLRAFNELTPEQRDQFVASLQGKPGSFVGQAIYKQGTELSEAMDDFQYGPYEVYTDLPEPILYEIKLQYRLYTTPDKAQGIPPHSHIEFRGTLADILYQSDSKPRKMDLKIKADEIKVLKD